MKVDEAIEEALRRRRSRCRDTDTKITQRLCGADVVTALPRQCIEEAVGLALDAALDAMAFHEEKCLKVTTRRGARGFLVELDYVEAAAERAALEAPPRPEQHELGEELSRCKDMLREAGARLYVNFREDGRTRILLELPERD